MDFKAFMASALPWALSMIVMFQVYLFTQGQANNQQLMAFKLAVSKEYAAKADIKQVNEKLDQLISKLIKE
ncbi:MAG: hypothetical protein HRT35_07370 [Algicola sp.]|nr:hypothetical protein [Algicola sp.]